MKKALLFFGVMVSSLVFSQVGMNTNSPTSTLDINAKNATGTSTNVDGLLIPRVDRQRAQSMTGIPTSTLIYINSIATGTQTGITTNVDTIGYYYYNGIAWIKLNSGSNINIYNSDGTLTGNRTVTQGTSTLAFNSTAVNGFSVDGNTFSVDAANNRIGIGTSSPAGLVNIVSDNTGSAAGNDFYFNGYGTSKVPGIFLGSANGTEAAPANLANGDQIGGFYFNPRINGGFAYTNGSNVLSSYRGDGTTALTDLQLSTSGVERMRINENGNIGIATASPSSSALLEMVSTSKGLLPPRMTAAQRDAINPKTEGLTIYNLDIHCLQYWNTTSWVGKCSNDGTAIITNCTSTPLNGSYTAGTPMNSSNTVALTVNVTQLGAWSASSNTVNGVTFSGSGNFTSLGTQTITLTASGTPTSSGTFNYTFTLGGSTCTRSITFVDGTSRTIIDCTSGALNGTYTQGVAMNSGNTVVITVNTNQTGPWSITSNTINGVTWSGSGTFTTTGNQTITLTASGTPVSSGAFNYTFTLGSSTCTRSITFGSTPPPPSTITNCNSGTLNGTYSQGVAMDNSNTVTITVNAGQTGPWSITSNTVNGVNWSGSGTFTTTGSQTITLTASGTPTNSGTFSYTFTLGSSTCTRSVTFAVNSSSTCPGQNYPYNLMGRSDFPNVYYLSGIPVTVSVTTSGTVPTNGQALPGSCGGNYTLDGWRIPANTPTTTTFTFSRPVSNVGLSFGGVTPFDNITVTAKNGNTPVNPTFPAITHCNQQDPMVGNSVSQNGRSRVAGVYYTSLTITSTSGNVAWNVMLCGAVAQ